MCVCYGIGGGSVGIRFKGPASLLVVRGGLQDMEGEGWAVAMKGEGDSLSVRPRTKALVFHWHSCLSILPQD